MKTNKFIKTLITTAFFLIFLSCKKNTQPADPGGIHATILPSDWSYTYPDTATTTHHASIIRKLEDNYYSVKVTFLENGNEGQMPYSINSSSIITYSAIHDASNNQAWIIDFYYTGKGRPQDKMNFVIR